MPGSQSVLTRLYEDIVVGKFSFGTKLGEEQIAERYKTKRHVLREAFGQLEEFGFVERVPNRGVYVREPHPREVAEIFDIRELLEVHAARIMSLPVPKIVTDRMREIQGQHTAAARASEYRDLLHLNTEFHRVQYSACGNATLVSAIEVYATRTHLITAMKFGRSDLMEDVIAQHTAIIRAMEESNHEVLVDAIRSHFDMARIEQYRQQYMIRHGNIDNADDHQTHRRLTV